MREGRAQPLDGDVRRPPLGDAAQVEPQTSRQPDAPPARFQLDVAPGSRRERASRLAGRRLAPRDHVEVPVLAQVLHLLLRLHCSVVHRYETPVVVVGTLNVGVVVMLLVSVPPLGVGCGVAGVVPALVWWAAWLAVCARWAAPANSAMAATAPQTRRVSVGAVLAPPLPPRPAAPVA